MRNSKIDRLWLLAPWVLLLGLGWYAVRGQPVTAQSGAESTPVAASEAEIELDWSEPVKLSRSGAIGNLRLFTDSAGVIHVLWRDTIISERLGYAFSTDDGVTWSEPAEINWPFNKNLPSFAVDEFDTVHAFWVEPDQELVYSRVFLDGFADPLQWGLPRRLAESALDVALVQQGQDNLHIAYVRPVDSEEFPAGIYYRYSLDGGVTWSVGETLFESQYYRSADRAQANIQLADATLVERAFVSSTVVITSTPVLTTTELVTTSEVLLIGWDNPALDEVLLRRSEDNGQTWLETQRLDGRDAGDLLEAVGPSDLKLVSHGAEVHALWRAGHGDSDCALLHRWSADTGRTWTEPVIVAPDATSCPEVIDVELNDDGSLWLVSRIEPDVTLLRWELAAGWSAPQIQSTLTQFIHPETFRLVDVDCHAFVQTAPNAFLAAACNRVNGDAWIMQQTFDPAQFYLTETPETRIWASPATLETAVNGRTRIAAPALVADTLGTVHAFWIQARETDLTRESEIRYARWDGEVWSEPLTILDAARNSALSLSATADDEGRIYLSWATVNGEIFATVADSVLVATESGWSEPTLVSQGDPAADPDILWHSGRLYLTFAVPLNEQRGVYVATSSNGRTWQPALQAYDGTAGSALRIGRPRLASAGDGELHVAWLEYGPNDRSLRSAYSASSDGGQTWNAAEALGDGASIWVDLAATGTTDLHRLWQEHSRDGITLWHQASADGGQSWARPVRIGDPTTRVRPVAIARANQGALYVLQATLSEAGTAELLQWQYESGFWLSSQTVPISDTTNVGVAALHTIVDPADEFIALYVTDAFRNGLPQLEQRLFSTVRTVPPIEQHAAAGEGAADALEGDAEAAPTPAPEASDAAAAAGSAETADGTQDAVDEPLEQPSPIPTLEFAREVTGSASSNRSSLALVGLIVGGAVTTLIAMLVIGILARRRR